MLLRLIAVREVCEVEDGDVHIRMDSSLSAAGKAE
jgi:hypothetical protein